MTKQHWRKIGYLAGIDFPLEDFPCFKVNEVKYSMEVSLPFFRPRAFGFASILESSKNVLAKKLLA